MSDLSFSISAAGGNQNGARAAEILQADLATIGVTVSLDVHEGPTFVKAMTDDDFDVASALYGGANGDPAGFFARSRPWRPADNFGNFESDEYTALLAEGGSTTDEDERRDIYREVGELILRENFMLVLGENPYLWAAASPLSGLRFGREGGYLVLEYAGWEG